MKIAVGVDQMTNGFNTPGGTEAQYVYNLAMMLASYGHQVDCYGGGYTEPPLWGNQEPIPNITFKNYWAVPTHVYDLFVNIPHEIRSGDSKMHKCVDTHIKAHKYAHCTFSWTDWSESALPQRCWEDPHNHLIFMPWYLRKFRNQNDNIRFVPFPYYKQVPVGGTGRWPIFWAARDPFNDDWAEHPLMSIYGAKLIKAVARVANKHNIKCLIFNGRAFETNRAREIGARQALDSIKIKEVFRELVPKNKLVWHLDRSIIAVTPPDQMGSCVDAMVHGAIPVLFKAPPPFNNYCEEGFDYIERMNQQQYSLNIGMSESEISQVLEDVYCLHPTEHMKLRAEMFHNLGDHSYKSAHAALLKAI